MSKQLLRHHGRVVNCKGLQSSKVVGSNPTGASMKYSKRVQVLSSFFNKKNSKIPQNEGFYDVIDYCRMICSIDDKTRFITISKSDREKFFISSGVPKISISCSIKNTINSSREWKFLIYFSKLSNL